LLRETISDKRINKIAREKAEAYELFTRKLKKRKGKNRKRQMGKDDEPIFLSEISLYLMLERKCI